MNLFVIGDVHGCYDQLVELLEKTDKMVKEDDIYVFLGDYIDRGPASKEVVDLLIERSQDHPNQHVFLMGNHEDMAINDPSNFLYNGGRDTLLSYEISPYDIMGGSFLNLIPREHEQFYRELQYYYHHGKVVCVHAGIDPALPIDDQSERTMLWTRSFVTYPGPYQNGYFVIFGHTPSQLRKNPHSLGIDTGCVFGGALTCVVIEPEEASVQYMVQVKGHGYED